MTYLNNMTKNHSLLLYLCYETQVWYFLCQEGSMCSNFTLSRDCISFFVVGRIFKIFPAFLSIFAIMGTTCLYFSIKTLSLTVSSFQDGSLLLSAFL